MLLERGAACPRKGGDREGTTGGRRARSSSGPWRSRREGASATSSAHSRAGGPAGRRQVHADATKMAPATLADLVRHGQRQPASRRGPDVVPRLSRVVQAVDAHACGEPGRVITGGVLDVPGETMFDKMSHFGDHADGLRKRMLREPRGYPAANCNLILPPTLPRPAAASSSWSRSNIPAMSAPTPSA